MKIASLRPAYIGIRFITNLTYLNCRSVAAWSSFGNIPLRSRITLWWSGWFEVAVSRTYPSPNHDNIIRRIHISPFFMASLVLYRNISFTFFATDNYNAKTRIKLVPSPPSSNVCVFPPPLYRAVLTPVHVLLPGLQNIDAVLKSIHSATD